MEAMNEKERTVALLKFLGVFFVAIILVNVAIYFDTKVPTKQLALLKAENLRLSSGKGSKKELVVLTDSIEARIARYETDLNKGFIDAQINGDINKLANIARGDSSEFGLLIGNMSQAYLFHMSDKKKLDGAGNCSEKIANKEKEINDLKDQMKELKRDYDLLKVMSATR